MSRNTIHTTQAVRSVLVGVAAAAADDDHAGFTEAVAAARAAGASDSQIVEAYASGGLQRLSSGHRPISFDWTNRVR